MRSEEDPGRTIVVTGGSGRLGRALARALPRPGDVVVLTYHRDARAAAEAVALSEGQGARTVARRLDLADARSVAEFCASLGRVDVLINNATGWNPPGRSPAAETLAGGSNEEHERQREQEQEQKEEQAAGAGTAIAANLIGPLRLTQQLIPLICASSGGRILNISSFGATRGLAGEEAIGAAKAGLHGITRSLAWSLSAQNVLVNTLVPGIMTETAGSLPAQLPQAMARTALTEIPLGRFPTYDEVAEVAGYLVSAANTAITGEAVRVTGGIA